MNIILLAPPAAGKGTEAQILTNEYSIPQISTGDLLREASNKEDELSKKIKDIMEHGSLVSDDIIIELIRKRINEKDCINGYILDGFPRTINQAEKYDEMLEEINNKIDYVFALDIDKELAASRISGRRTCPNCNRIYNVNSDNLKPMHDNLCDDCGVELKHRKDDNAETYENRYNAYLEQTAPLIEYYEKKNILYHIDSNVDKNNTHKQIKEIIIKGAL